MNILIPVDFTPASLNAAHFAVKMLLGQYDETAVLLHVYEDASKEAQVKQQLRDLRDSLLDEAIVKIETIAEHNDDFLDTLERRARHLDAALVVMASTEKSKIEQAFTGNNSLKMIEKNVCPVLVVPEDARFSAIKNVAIACDFKDIEASIPIVPVKKVLSLFQPFVHIVNVNSDIYVSLNEEYLAKRQLMAEMFQEFHPEFYFITTFNFHETLQQFVKDKKIDLVLTFPRTHSFIDNLFKTSKTKKLLYESDIPVLAAHE
ncbi:MAG: universal stress protein [Candidatus Dadabacteria bacterium]